MTIEVTFLNFMNLEGEENHMDSDRSQFQMTDRLLYDVRTITRPAAETAVK